VYEAREQADIMTELQAASTVDASKIEGTFEYDVLSSNSIEFAKVEVELEQAYKAAFADTSWGDYLTMRAEEAGVIRKAAVKAIGTVTVSGNGTLPAGSTFATSDGTQFVTDAAVVITKSGDVAVTAVTAGSAGNTAAGTIVLIPMSIPGITTVTNATATHDGYDEETDADLLSRYLLHVRTPGTSGNKYHYIEWATSVSGVGAAKCIPVWNGPTTVKVIVVDSNFAAASTTLVQKVADYIETVRPVGAVVTVVSAVPVVINIVATIAGSINQGAFETAIKAYFTSMVKASISNSTSSSVSINKVGSLLYEAGGVTDYSNLQLNGGTTNIAISADELAALGTVTINV